MPFFIVKSGLREDFRGIVISFDTSKPIKVALIDDDQDVLQITALMFKNAIGATVETYSSIALASKSLDEFSPDFLICDQRLGHADCGVSGLDFLVKARVEGFAGRLVLLSGYVSAELRASATLAKIDIVLEKPIYSSTIAKLFRRFADADEYASPLPRGLPEFFEERS